jgi:hypothetical protein
MSVDGAGFRDGPCPDEREQPILAALWHESKGEWDRAHEIVQDLEGSAAALVHAYLHRREGDRSNARYWYGQAGRPEAGASLDEEWHALVEEFGG